MNYNDKKRLHMALYDGEKNETVTVSPSGYMVKLNDKQKLFSLADGTQIVRHYEEGIGFNNTHHWITGNCYDFDLSAFTFKDTAEAIDICTTYSFINYLMDNVKKDAPEFPQILMLRQKYFDFLETRVDVNRPTRVNIDEKLKRFDFKDYMSDQDYAAYLQYHIEAKQQIKDYQNSPEYAVASFINEQKEAKKAMRRERMINLKQKFLGRFSSASRSKKRIAEQAQAITSALTGGAGQEDDQDL